MESPDWESPLESSLGHVISPGRASLTELPGALERWEEQVSKYKNSKEPSSRMTETQVHKHDITRDDPMDLNSVVKGKGKNKFSGSCYICGKVGHKATECWSRDRASNKEKASVRRARYRRSERTSKGHPKGQGKSKSKGKGKGKSKGRKGFQSGRPADSLEFEEEPWDETNETEPEEWWNSWADGAEPNRDGAPLGTFVLGGTELELNSFKTASGEILPDEGQLMWPCFLQESQMPASRACHGCSQASDLSRQGARQRQSGHLAFQWRLDPLLELPHWDLDFKSNDEGPKASTDGRAHQVV